jgi:hypothetical protein
MATNLENAKGDTHPRDHFAHRAQQKIACMRGLRQTARRGVVAETVGTIARTLTAVAGSVTSD